MPSFLEKQFCKKEGILINKKKRKDTSAKPLNF